MKTVFVDLRTLAVVLNKPVSGFDPLMLYFIDVETDVDTSQGDFYYSPVTKLISTQKPSIAEMKQVLKDIPKIFGEYFLKWVDANDIVKLKTLGVINMDLPSLYTHLNNLAAEVKQFAFTLDYRLDQQGGLTYEQFKAVDFAWPTKATISVNLPTFIS
ncbi:hypothetical protein AXL65_02210 [Salmonella enterica subsp. enterica]|nr:hypothetical protein [Salmonella enterica subsp. enterica]